MGRMLFSLSLAILALTPGCQSSPSTAPNSASGQESPSLFSRLFGSNSPKKPNGAAGVKDVPLGPNGLPLGQKTKLDLAIESTMKRGGLIQIEYEILQKYVVAADLHGFHNAAAALEKLAPLIKLREVNLHGTSFNDADLVVLRGLPNLQNVNLSATNITDAGMASLQTLPNLRTLNLNETRVTDAGLQYLRGMANLSELSLYGTKVSDQGVAQLRGLEMLHKLVLGGSSSITDRSLHILGDMTQLRDLTILSSRVTDTGIENLKIASSQLRIIH
ncbi:MAG TPA: hypothetical protein VMF69_26535 [Gemmataceae bacterium]|nr:hypothetical protein [Gemmataceae bacterium]